MGDCTDLLKSYRYDRIKDIQEPVQHCKGTVSTGFFLVFRKSHRHRQLCLSSMWR